MGAEPVTKVSIEVLPTFGKRVRLQRPDGSPATGASISVAQNSAALRNLALFDKGHGVAPADAEAYQRHKTMSMPGHSAVADAEGNAILGNLPRGTTTCEVKWTDPKSNASHAETVEIATGSSEQQVVNLTGKKE